MTEEHLKAQVNGKQNQQGNKRKRMPSQYSNQIADFKNNVYPSMRRNRSSNHLAPNSQQQLQQSNIKNADLLCKLPNGRSYHLKIIVTKDKKNKNQSPPPKRAVEKVIGQPLSFEKKEKSENMGSLLDIFLEACQQLQKKEENISEQKQNEAISKESDKVGRREVKVRKERQRQQKFVKYYQKYQHLQEKLEKLSLNYFLLQ